MINECQGSLAPPLGLCKKWISKEKKRIQKRREREEVKYSQSDRITGCFLHHHALKCSLLWFYGVSSHIKKVSASVCFFLSFTWVHSNYPINSTACSQVITWICKSEHAPSPLKTFQSLPVALGLKSNLSSDGFLQTSPRAPPYLCSLISQSLSATSNFFFLNKMSQSHH